MSSLPSNEIDVAIVGAGIAGLAVARALHTARQSVRVFEARPRTGGRVLSAEVPGGRADLGPTWFWPGEHRIGALVSEFRLPIHEQYTTGDAVIVRDGKAHRSRGFGASPAFRLSAGAQSLTDALTSEVPADLIQCDTPVERVEQSTDGVAIHTADGLVTARSAVLALPPSLVMSTGLVDPATLDPSVAANATQIPVWMGGITKAVAVYHTAFWRDLGLSGMVSAMGAPFGEIHDMSGPDGSPAMLFGFAQAAGPSTPTAAIFVEQLVALFGDAAESPVEAIALDWSGEKFTTPTTGNGSQRYDLFGSPLLRSPSWDGRLHWASTETGAEAPGHLEGALEAAERTVRMLTN